MNKKRITTLCLVVSFILAGCSSNVDQTDLNETETAIPTATNGLGVSQIQRYKIAVLPTKVDISQLNIPSTSANTLSESITHELVSALNDTHKFDVIIPNTSYKIIEQDQLEKIADFVLVSSLQQLDAQETSRILKATGQNVDEKLIFSSLNYQIINTKNNYAVLSKSVRSQIRSNTSSDSLGKLLDSNVKQTVQQIKEQVITEIYPIRVVAVIDNQQVVLDQALSVGTECELFTVGKKITDIYNNNVLGHEESYVGTARITRSTAVLSFANVTHGKPAKGAVCKPILIEKVIGAPEHVTQTERGGIKLPFD